ncbi:hypothetical protein PPERSA_08096 [Pseudocohnilembus persalinus]|uniref:Uncharacterized protein n=1 Tax=Pseudocohnilembus persalinus TaxID=266149 RepID=A0A0V0R2S0_PSEPJ|nr:hypothetical protein PPERSA_08096 [Pseudocohnilembus persalinus]|eukprot:KRX08785.1 hypothetical protein PPERSA_08096 [Pseudocohnilembus persalinus]
MRMQFSWRQSPTQEDVLDGAFIVDSNPITGVPCNTFHPCQIEQNLQKMRLEKKDYSIQDIESIIQQKIIKIISYQLDCIGVYLPYQVVAGITKNNYIDLID